MAKELTREALKEINKVGDSTNTEVVVLKSNICQNLAQFHKQSSEFAESLKMSEQALEANPNNWKALANKADISANRISLLG